MKEINAQGRRNMKGMNAIEGTYITGNDRKEERKRERKGKFVVDTGSILVL